MFLESNFANKKRAVAQKESIMAKNIKGKIEELYNEIWRARNIVNDIIGSLKACNVNTNLTQDIGVFARQMPEFKILAEQRVTYLSYLRQVCTGENSIEKALELFQVAKKQLDEGMACIKL